MSDEGIRSDRILTARELAAEELTPEEFAEMEERAIAHERQEQLKQAKALLVTMEEWRRTLPENVTAQDVKDKLDEIIIDFESLMISVRLIEPPRQFKSDQDDSEIPF